MRKLHDVATRELIANYLEAQIKKGKVYFRSKEIAQELGLTVKTVAMHLSNIRDNNYYPPLFIMVWSRSQYAVTWKITWS